MQFYKMYGPEIATRLKEGCTAFEKGDFIAGVNLTMAALIDALAPTVAVKDTDQQIEELVFMFRNNLEIKVGQIKPMMELFKRMMADTDRPS